MLIAETLQNLPIGEEDMQAERPVVISRTEGRVFSNNALLNADWISFEKDQ